MLEFLRRQLAVLIEERSTAQAQLEDVLSAPTAENRGLSADEQALFDDRAGAVDAYDARIAEMQARVEEAERRAERASASAAAALSMGATGQHYEPGRVTFEPTTYQRGGQCSYFRDLVSVSLNRADQQAARDRLARNRQEVVRESRALSTVDGAGGEFVPPAWMVDEYVALARAGRPTADRVRNLPLPGGTDTINLPKMATGTAVAEQASQNTAVTETNATTTSVAATVATIAGQQVLSVQLIEQSPVNMDQVLLADLAADYATKLDVFVLSNNAAGKLGLLNVAGVNAVTYTDTTPTLPELYPKIGDAIQRVHVGRFLPADTIVMHPRRWAWALASLDTQNRPLVVPSAQGPFNAAASSGDVAAAGVVGSVQGIPVIVDPNVPTNLGAGANEDAIIVFRAADVILYEGQPRAEAFRETKADSLGVLLRFYSYAALHASRYPQSISVISGTGLIAPTF